MLNTHLVTTAAIQACKMTPLTDTDTPDRFYRVKSLILATSAAYPVPPDIS